LYFARIWHDKIVAESSDVYFRIKTLETLEFNLHCFRVRCSDSEELGIFRHNCSPLEYSQDHKYRHIASTKKFNNFSFYWFSDFKIGTQWVYEFIMQCAKFCSVSWIYPEMKLWSFSYVCVLLTLAVHVA